ncbi:MAG: hypothetical protein WA849_00375 [Candidatus Udaeobacter sp.]
MLPSARTPGVFLNLYNTTDETFTLTRAQFRPVITIPAHSAADIPLAYQAGERVLIRSSHHAWVYSPRSLSPPYPIFQHQGMVMRAFAKIDRSGEISIIVPAGTQQPEGF